MEWEYDSVTLSVIAVSAVLAVLLITAGAVLLHRQRKTGAAAGTGTLIDTILLPAGVVSATAFYAVLMVFETVAETRIGSNESIIPMFIPVAVIVKVCGSLFIICFFAWAVLRTLYNSSRETALRRAMELKGATGEAV